jgi:hypothetical protein
MVEQIPAAGAYPAFRNAVLPWTSEACAVGSNGSEHGEPLNANNSVGFVGTRRTNGKLVNVNLQFLTVGQPEQGRRYAFTTDLSDADFESIVREWRLAVLAGNRKEAAKHTHFPLRVNVRRRHETIRTPAELSQQWDRIFTPAFLTRIRRDLPHDMRGENSSLLVMLGRKAPAELFLPEGAFDFVQYWSN